MGGLSGPFRIGIDCLRNLGFNPLNRGMGGLRFVTKGAAAADAVKFQSPQSGHGWFKKLEIEPEETL
mgnify:CR=1 FL=1